MKGRNSATSRPIPAPPNRPKQHALREQKYVSPLVNGLVAMVETSFTPPVSPLHKKSPVDNTNEEAQEALDTIQRLSKEATLRDTGKFFHHMHSTLEHAILYRKGKGQFNVYFKDVVKGIEMKLNGGTEEPNHNTLREGGPVVCLRPDQDKRKIFRCALRENLNSLKLCIQTELFAALRASLRST